MTSLPYIILKIITIIILHHNLMMMMMMMMNIKWDQLNIHDPSTFSTTKEVFSLEDIDFGVKCLANGKTKDIEGYQAKKLKIGGHVLILYIYKLFNIAVKQGFLHLGLKASLFLFSEVVIKITPLIIRLLWLSLS